MSEVSFGHVVTVPDGDDMSLTGVTDMLTVQTARGPVLYTISRMDGGWITAHRIGSDGGLTQIDSLALDGSGMAGAVYGLALLEGAGGGPQLLVTGVDGTGFHTVDIASSGGLSAPDRVGGDDVSARVLDTAMITVRGDTVIYTALRGADDVSAYRIERDGDVDLVHGPAAGRAQGVGITSLGTAEVGGQDFLLVASGGDNALVSYRLTGSGRPQETDRVSATEDSLGISTPSAVEVVEVGGQSFAIMASSGSSTLTVVRVGEGGTLVLTDHVLDTRDTRFGGAATLDTLSHEGRGFVAVAGNDDGISLFEVMVDGRLLHLGSLADTTATTVAGVSALSLGIAGSDLHLAVTSGAEAGVTGFSIDMNTTAPMQRGTDGNDTLNGANAGGQITGGAGNDRLTGGNGADLLIDGAGSDVMTGGRGADYFFLTGDGVRDTIRDFNIRQDTLDLSGWALLRSPSQLTFSNLSNGIEIRFGDEVLVLQTHNGNSLRPSQITSLDLIGQSRFLPDWFEAELQPEPEEPDEPEPRQEPDARGDPEAGDMRLTGTSRSDDLSGGLGNDTIDGLGAGDVLSGRAGNDVIDGRGGNDRINGNADSDILRGGSGNDFISGGQGFDTMEGNSGSDTLIGSDGFDLIRGGSGNDSLTGNNGADALFGEDGDDILWGGLNIDSMFGGNGDDVFYGQSGGDIMDGGSGEDTLEGNAGADTLDGGLDDDLLSGGINHDTLTGGRGADTLMGGNGSDLLRGERGHDSLIGNAGNDTLEGGSGDDYLFGGVGADSFVFDQGIDRIADFGLVDTLVLDRDLWVGGALSLARLERFATVTRDGDLLFDFGGGNELLLNNVTSVASIYSDIEFL